MIDNKNHKNNNQHKNNNNKIKILIVVMIVITRNVYLAKGHQVLAIGAHLISCKLAPAGACRTELEAMSAH